MTILYGQHLVEELRKLADKVSNRLWIAVPYIGSPISIRKILGRTWFDSPTVNVKLLTDTSDLSCINTESVQHFHDRGEIKSLQGLHAKIYIIDDVCIVTSANLTNTAFSKRHEIGIKLSGIESKQILEIFNSWWNMSKNVSPDQLIKIYKTKKGSKDEIGFNLPIIFNLPTDPGSFVKNLQKRFLNYARLVADFEDFGQKYSSIQRIWSNQPLNLEIDGLFNYLYHHAPDTPSKGYSEVPRKLNEVQQLNEIKYWAQKYKKWNVAERNGEDINWRVNNSKKIRSYLSPKKILTLTEQDVETLLLCTNSINADQRNKAKILKENSLIDIRNGLNELANGSKELSERMNFCNQIKGLGPSTMNELIGFSYPKKYPIINKNSSSGLRFFGYQTKAYK
ncbi:MAG: phospholipase D-like domain-containing protein [Bacteroidota bacterium]|nr:phospholipase D-like domain-containing protein [Bacteroidota bacterium]